MKQVVQSLADGRTEVIDVPAPQARPGHLLVATHASLLSAGTERMLLEFGRAGLLGKIRQQPDKVRQVIDKFRADGLWPTLEAVRSRLAQPVPMGYSNVGTVLDVGAGMTGFEPGDRVVSNGPHAEVVCVPKNLCARVPEAVSDDAAAFTVVGSIALEGLRLARPTLGESFAVIGLGLVGLLAVQLLRANGCRVLGLDFDRDRLALSERFGAETIDLSCVDDPVPHALRFAGGGVDGVLICAATQKNDPAAHAARMCRKRGRIVLVGVCGLELSRADFYEKELSFQVSCSYGPGRYDAAYEQGGRDYPLPFVRWTAQRNFGAVLDLLGSGRLDTAPLVTHCYPIERAIEAYGVLGGGAPSLGILLEYAAAANAALEAASAPDAGGLLARSVSLVAARASVEHAGRIRGSAPVGVGFIGVGEFAVRVLLPAFRAAGADVRCVAGRNGLTAAHAARKFSIPEATTDARRILDDPACAAVVIATRHDSHAEYVRQALEAGKHVFVEKPLAITAEQLDTLEDAFAEAPWRDGSSPLVMVGFNRRFSPHVRKMQELLDGVVEPKSFLYTVNAGAIPAGHWTQDAAVGGGRIVGECCHFIDLVRHLCGSSIVSVQATMLGGSDRVREDKLTVTLAMADGSFGAIHYLANGHRGFPKERLEVFCGGRVLQLDNFRRLTGWGWKHFRRTRLWRQDRGHRQEVRAFLQAVAAGKPSPVPFEEAAEVTRATFAAVEAAQSGNRISLACGDDERKSPLRRCA